MTDVIAQLQAEIERREDEIVALREVIAMLQGSPAIRALPKPEGNPPRVAPKAAKARPAPKALPAPARAIEPGSNRDRALELLRSMEFVSAEAMEEIFGGGQKRHNGIFNLKAKLELEGETIVWSRDNGYALRSVQP